ncbi:cell filamentation protein [Sphingobium sp. TB-6]|uniref:Fic/DOC family protein n=1 Tax=Sphingobium sp. TB-6 TaxID=2728850 RepID=UPI00146B55F6|nr:Fic family protein [Sphingobium sp. TB-6]NML91941.1 cell filamentation protein [Sphingobium sp. TB-6]
MTTDHDPTFYPGSTTLQNRLELRDERALAQAERLLTHARGHEAARMTFSPDADGYRARHKHLFGDLYDWAGQDRTVNIGETGGLFTHAPYVAGALSAAFQDLARHDRLQGLAPEDFFDRLGHHLGELHAIHPFRAGNARTLRHHAAQLARDAGHPIRIASIDKQAWGEASRHGLLTGDHRLFSATLAAAAVDPGAPLLPRTGPGGIAFLPPRDPPTGQRYRLPLAKVREELDHYLPAARAEAADRLKKLVQGGEAEARISAARVELAYVRHAKGPLYQTQLLSHLGQREVDAVITAQQTPLERVREIGAALAARINTQQPAQVLRTVRSLERPILPSAQSPAQERLADLFLKNTPEQNKADPRFLGAEALLERVQQASRAKGDGTRLVEGATDAARTAIAANMRAGRPFDEGIVLGSSKPSRRPAPDRGRSR